MASYALFFLAALDRPTPFSSPLTPPLASLRTSSSHSELQSQGEASHRLQPREKEGGKETPPSDPWLVRTLREGGGGEGETSSFPLQNERSPSLHFMHTSCRYRQEEEEEGAKDLQTYSPNLRLLRRPPPPPPAYTDRRCA